MSKLAFEVTHGAAIFAQEGAAFSDCIGGGQAAAGLFEVL